MTSLSIFGRAPARGFSLIEALIAMLVLSFGLLAIASFQATLSRSTDLAKQRSEATRLAQDKMESLRNFTRAESLFGALPHIANYEDDVVNSAATEVIASNTNAEFKRSWTVTPSAGDTERFVVVRVEWMDRAGETQQVQLNSVISKWDPRYLGWASVSASGVTGLERRPKNRNINVPYPAVTLSNGNESAFTPPPGNVIYVFDNVSGNIVRSCTPQAYPIALASGTNTTVDVTTTGNHPFVAGDAVTIAGSSVAAFNGTFPVTLAPTTTTFTHSLSIALAATTASTGGTATKVIKLVEGIDLSATPGITCSTLNAYLLSGYVRFDTGNNPIGQEPTGNQAMVMNLTSPARYDTRPLASGTGTPPLSLDTSNVSGTAPAMTCYAQQQKVVTTSPTSISLASLSRSGSTVTVTTSTSHGFNNGDIVAINGVLVSGVTSPAFIGAFAVRNVSTTTFEYTLPPPVTSAISGSGGTAVRVQRLTIPETDSVAGYGNVAARFVSYACVVTPVDHDNSPATPNRWWGKVTINANASSSVGPTWNIANGSGNFKVCRFSADFNSNGAIGNSEHPRWYRAVTGALDSQNFLVIAHGQPCPTDKKQDLLGNPVNFADETTAEHQPSSEPSFQCGNGNNCSPKNVLETSSTTDLTMD